MLTKLALLLSLIVVRILVIPGRYDRVGMQRKTAAGKRQNKHGALAGIDEMADSLGEVGRCTPPSDLTTPSKQLHTTIRLGARSCVWRRQGETILCRAVVVTVIVRSPFSL